MPNIPGAENIPLQRELHARIKLPVIVENDANCFALAESLHGAGKGKDVVLGITMGTGVGGGIVIGGKLYRGSNGFAGEIGHMLLKPGEPPFATSDKRGDVEQFLSGTALGKRCREAKSPEEYLEGEVCGFLQPMIFREIAWMCVTVIHLLDPSVIVFGGSAGRALEPHIPEIQKELRTWLLPGTPLPHLSIATLKDAGTRGAALLHEGKP
jgi:predicted NBD/HSP70 family sugar kinase